MKLQQGDVLLRRTNISIRQGKKLDHLILAEGEATGHNRIKHQEYKEFDVPKGNRKL